MAIDSADILPNTPAPDTGSAQPMGLTDAIRAMFDKNGGVPAVKTPYGDEQKILKAIKDFKQESSQGRQVFERTWWRNLLYVLNRQWIYWDNRKGWVDKRLAKWIPRPVTNKCAETAQSIRALFDSVQLGVIVRPVGSDPSNVMTAELADDMGPLIHAEHDMDRQLRLSDFNLTVYGNTFIHPWWDTNPQRGTIVIPHEMCAQCGETFAPGALTPPTAPTCPKCGGTTFVDAADESGEPITTAVPQGRGQTDVCSPFEIFVPLIYTDFSDIPGLMRGRFRPKRWYEANLPDFAKKIKWETMPADRSLQLLKSVSTQSDYTNAQNQGSGVGEMGQVEGTSEFELWMKPCEDWPDGLVARMAGNDVLITKDDEGLPGPLPLKTKTGERIFPWIHTGFETFGGRLWARSPIDLIIQKQDMLNQLDSFTQLIIQRTANPVWLEPKGAEVRALNGEPGLIVKWNPMSIGGTLAKPERIPGQEVPQSITIIRQQIIEDIEQSTATYDILKGAKPAGVNAFSSLQLLVERSQSRFSMVLASRGEAYRDWYRIALEMERQYGPALRTASVLGPNRTWTIQSFQNSQLQGDVEIVVEDGSQAPKTNLGKRAAIEHANQLGLIDPADPDQKYTILQTFGLTTLIPQLDSQVKGALQEQDSFEKWATQTSPENLPPTPPGMAPLVPIPPSPAQLMIWHNDQIHISEHMKWANSDKARQVFATNPNAIPQWQEHIIQHMMRSGMLPPGMMPVLPPGADGSAPPPQGAALAMQNSNANAGNQRARPNQRPVEDMGGNESAQAA
jgi:hypothetical protein